MGTSSNETADTMDLGPCSECGRKNPFDARFCGGCGFQFQGGDDDGPEENVADPLIGRVIADRYRIIELLGRGGMGVVYKVEHIHIGKFMAMKLLHGELARDRNTVKRFQREAEAISRLSHPNSVQVFDFGRSEGLMYLVMEYLEGRDLGQVIRDEGHLDFQRVARLASQVCASVAQAHAEGVVHRDLKPENVMILPARQGSNEIAKVLDFGLAKLRDQMGNVTVTRAGHIVGTPYYMAPEQIKGEDVDARGDVYAIGAMIYKACTGVPPFVANTPMGVLTKHLTEELVPPSSRSGFHLPPDADRIVGRAMQKEREDRYQDAESLRQDLLLYLQSVGEALSEPTMSGIKVGRAQPEGVATRGDVEKYERRLRRRGAALYVLLVALLAGAGFGGWKLWQRYEQKVETLTAELEPNNTPETANPLPADTEVTALLGKRQDREFGDIDLYALEGYVPDPAGRVLRVDVSALPNIDVMVDVIRVGQQNPVLSADSVGAGSDERIPNFPLGDHSYMIRVHERWITGRLPTENVSDHYTVQWSYGPAEAGFEIEVNDSLELATPISSPGSIQGFLGWAGDVDTFCVRDDEANAGTADIAVSGLAGVDVVLRVVDRTLQRSRKVDEQSVGAGEAMAGQTIQPGRTCVELSLNDPRDAVRRAQPNEPYTLTFSPAAAVPEPVEP